MSQPSHSFSFDTDIFNNYLEESPSFSSDTPATVEPSSAGPDTVELLKPSPYPLGFDHLPPISIWPASPPRRALPAAPTSQIIAPSVSKPDSPLIASASAKRSSQTEGGSLESKAVFYTKASPATTDDDAWSGILDETPRAEEDNGREFFRERFASNGYKFDRSEDMIGGPSEAERSYRSRESSTSRVDASVASARLSYRAPQAVPLPASPSVSRTSSHRSRSYSLSTTAPPLPSTSANPSPGEGSLTTRRSFSPLRPSDYDMTRRSSTPYLTDTTREKPTSPRRRSEAPLTAAERANERAGRSGMESGEVRDVSRYARQRASTESIGKGSALSSIFDSASSPS